MTPSRSASTVRIDSTAPTAPTEWPSADFGAYTAGLVAAQRVVDRLALGDVADLVPVACALTWSMSVGSSPASWMARVIACPACSPLGSGATMW